MPKQVTELAIIQALSERIIAAQQQIRILDFIKWDETVKEAFFSQKAQVQPLVDVDYYKNRPLPFDPHVKIEEFRTILRDAQNQLGQYAAETRLIKRQCDEYIRAVQMLVARGTP